MRRPAQSDFAEAPSPRGRLARDRVRAARTPGAHTDRVAEVLASGPERDREPRYGGVWIVVCDSQRGLPDAAANVWSGRDRADLRVDRAQARRPALRREEGKQLFVAAL